MTMCAVLNLDIGGGSEMAAVGDLVLTGEGNKAPFTQKIVDLGAGTFVGWSGDLGRATHLLEYLRDQIRISPTEDVGKLVDDYNRSLDGLAFFSLRMRSGLINLEMFPSRSNPIRTEPYGFFVGSGATEVSTWADICTGKGQNETYGYDIPWMIAHRIWRIIARSSVNPRTLRAIRRRDWGLGHEVVIRKPDDTFAKMNAVAMTTYHVSRKAAKYNITRRGPKFYQYYDNDTFLFNLVQGTNVSRWVVEPPFSRDRDYEFSAPPVPEWSATLFIDEDRPGSDSLFFARDASGVHVAQDGPSIQIEQTDAWLQEALRRLEAAWRP